MSELCARRLPAGLHAVGLHAVGLHAVGLALIGCAACAHPVAAPPADAEYPALRLPARFEAAPPPAPASASAASASPASAPAPGGARLDSEATPPAAGGSGSSGASGPPAHGYLPDPPALNEREQWVYDIEYDRGTVRVKQPIPLCLRRAAPSARRMGRFAFELWLGRELVERVRFEFPLLATETPETGSRRPVRAAPSFARGAHVSARLQIPASTRATSARVLDRATGETWDVEWPPHSSSGEPMSPCAPAPAADAAGTPPG